jgi:hypothetical protein
MYNIKMELRLIFWTYDILKCSDSDKLLLLLLLLWHFSWVVSLVILK